MSLFMFLSGFVSYKKDNHLSDIYKRAYQLLVPFFFWPLVSELLMKGEITMSYYSSLIKEPDRGLWFLLLLFYISTFFSSINILSKIWNRYVRSIQISPLLISFVLMLVAQILIYSSKRIDYGLYFFFRYSLVYFSGLVAKKYFYKIEDALKKYWWMYLILFFILSNFWKFQHSPTFIPYPTHFLVSISYTWLVSFIGTAMVFSLCLRVKQGSNNKIVLHVCQCGGMTLGIYAIHLSLVLHLVVKMMKDIDNYGYSTRILCVFVITFSCSWIIHWILDKGNISSQLLLGKLKSKP